MDFLDSKYKSQLVMSEWSESDHSMCYLQKQWLRVFSFSSCQCKYSQALTKAHFYTLDICHVYGLAWKNMLSERCHMWHWQAAIQSMADSQ